MRWSAARFLWCAAILSSLPAGAAEPAPESYWPAPQTNRPALAAPPPQGPFEPTWASLEKYFRVPEWFRGAKFGIFIHWGLYAVPAYHNEWYARHMYDAFRDVHTQIWGPPDQFGYKDFIPLFTPDEFDADAWADLFQRAGARYVIPCAEHHDGYAMYDSEITPWCAGRLGPRRDFIGELADAIRKRGLVFGVSSHRMEHHTFMYPPGGPDGVSDQFDPRFRDFYGPPIPGHMNDGNATAAFQEEWLLRCAELVDKYRPQMVWFDNGINAREYDPIKLKFAAYYYNRAHEWGADVSISSKSDAFAPSGDPRRQIGSILDFEKVGHRSPADMFAGEWQVDDPIGSTWGYTTAPKPMTFSSAQTILAKLIDTVSKGGTYLLNVSPDAEGVIPEPQPRILLEVGAWLATHGEAIYDTRPWIKYIDESLDSDNRIAPGIRFTVKGSALYALTWQWPGEEVVIRSLATGAPGSGPVDRVVLLGHDGELRFSQDAGGLRVALPSPRPDSEAWVLKILGLELEQE